MLFSQKLSAWDGFNWKQLLLQGAPQQTGTGRGTVNPSGGGWEWSILLGHSLVMPCIPFTGTAECARDTQMPWEMSEELPSSLCCGRGFSQLRLLNTQQSGHERNLSDCNIAHCSSWVGEPLCFLMKRSSLPSDN